MGVVDPTPPAANLEEKIKIRRTAFAEYMTSVTTRDELIHQPNKANIAWGNVYKTDEFLQQSETLKHRKSVLQIDDRHGGTRPTFQSPYRFSTAASGVSKGAPFQGEYNAEILDRYG